MSVANPTMGQATGEQNGADHPALNDRAFQRVVQASGATDRGMTATGAYVKTLLLLAIFVAAASFGWSEVRVVDIAGQIIPIAPAWTWLAFFLSFIFGMAGIFANRAIPIIAIGYALSQGALVGLASHYYNIVFDGIVFQAVIATICVFGATLLLYLTGVIKATSRLAMGLIVAMSALMLVYFTAWLFSLFGVSFRFFNQPTPLGIAFSLGVVLLGALNLPLNFEFIRRAAAAGAPKFMEWYGAYGLMLSIIWMYVSILRVLALLRMSRR